MMEKQRKDSPSGGKHDRKGGSSSKTKGDPISFKPTGVGFVARRRLLSWTDVAVWEDVWRC